MCSTKDTTSVCPPDYPTAGQAWPVMSPQRSFPALSHTSFIPVGKEAGILRRGQVGDGKA